MVDLQTQQHAIGALSTVIVEMIEDISPEAVLSVLAAPDDGSQRFEQLGQDITTIAAAIMVLERLGADDEPG